MTKIIFNSVKRIIKKIRAAFTHQQLEPDNQWSPQLYKRHDSHYFDAKADGNKYRL
jgi:hypothetical protein